MVSNSKTQLRNALNRCSHAHSSSIWSLDRASVGTLHNDLCSNDFYFTSVVEPTANSCFHEQESPILTAGKIVSRALDCGMKYCNYSDITSVYSLNSRKLPGRFSYGLGTRLAYRRSASGWLHAAVNAIGSLGCWWSLLSGYLPLKSRV